MLPPIIESLAQLECTAPPVTDVGGPLICYEVGFSQQPLDQFPSDREDNIVLHLHDPLFLSLPQSPPANGPHVAYAG